MPRQRWSVPARCLRIAAALLSCAALPAALRAQDSAAVAPAAPPADSAPAPAAVPLPIRPPLSPGGAFWRSLLLPGWGQAKAGRSLPAAIFLGVEGVTLAMSIRADRELAYLRRTGSVRVDAKSQEREDWLVLLAFNHLLSGLEAFVSAHLWDFPGDIAVTPAPAGGVTAGLSFPVKLP